MIQFSNALLSLHNYALYTMTRKKQINTYLKFELMSYRVVPIISILGFYHTLTIIFVKET